ncbi:MAG: UDP-N-acetylmuramate dehydrogenase [Hungatella sp.]|jgi:UDP-N-acetylmuramate dehydrogenase|nr:UDP-N-acetylmuramate dehydrogenase [Hungatella sp.]
MAEFHERLQKVLAADSVRTEESMRDHTTFRIGGPAKYFVTPKTQKELTDTVGLCRKEAMAFYVIGNGSNLLVSDKGYEGVIISTEGLASWQAAEDGEAVLSASAGILLSRLAKAAASKSLTGLEFAAGIPGTLGGAVVMNAGAYGSEMKDVICWARVLDRQGVVRTLTLEELGLGYRTSRVPAEGYVVLEAGLRLAEGCQEEIYKKMEDLAARRRKKQPLEYPSAGSAFKRPPGHFAGKLIDDAGLRGFRIGDAQVSEKHCGFVINRGNATEAQVTELCREVRRRVKEQFGVELELEVKKL